MPRWVDPGWRRTIVQIAVMLEASGLDKKITDFEYYALDERGARAIAQQAFFYNAYFEDLTVSDLATVKADGRIIPIDDRAIRDQPASTNSASPYFDEQRIKIAAFADVEAGDRIRGHLTYTAKRAILPNAYAGFWTQSLDTPPEVMKLTIDGPTSMPLRIATRGVDDEVETRGDRMIHHVIFRQDKPRPLVSSVDGFETARRFEVSTFKDYAALALALATSNAPMAKPDEELRRLSGEISGDATTVRAKVERIHNWVARSIRYVGIGFEDGGLISQPASTVLAARYGDCKAHATLLKALLSVQNIEADLVAVNAAPRYTLTSVATLGFDHMIVYIPTLDLYLDPTAPSVAFGTLPSTLYGKPVLNIDRGRLNRIPVLRPDQNQIGTDITLTLHPDGKLEARSTLSGSGVGATLGRLNAIYLENIDKAQFVSRRLTKINVPGTGTYAFTNPRDLADHFVIEAPFAIDQPLDLLKVAAIRMMALTDPRPPIADLVIDGEAEAAFPCSSIDVTKIAALDLPDGTNVFEFPSNLAIDEIFRGQTALGPVNGHFMATGTIRVSDRKVRSTIRLSFDVDAPVCPVEFAAGIKEELAKLSGFANAPIGITPNEVSFRSDSSPDAVAARSAFNNKDYASARKLWTVVAGRGSSDAQNSIGWMYKTGKGVDQDFAEAFRWYLRSAAQGDALGQSHVAYFYSCGCGVVRSDTQAVLWYRRSASQGFAYAEGQLAEMTLAGRGTEKDPAQAVKWYEKAASQDNLDAQKMLGTIYQGKFGVGADYAKAAQWLRVAADKNDSEAQMSLATLYSEGRGVSIDDMAAAAWLQRAADQGLAEAQYELAWLYELGRGVSKDKTLALIWYGKADQQGHQGARVRLDALSESDDSAVSAELLPPSTVP